jgi:hypothetical protein
VVAAFDWGAWYGIALAVAGAITTFGGAVVIVVAAWRHVSHRVDPQPPRMPDVVLGHPGAQISLTPLHELQEGEHRRLVAVRPTYLIENKEATRSIRDVSTGVRTRDGSQKHVFDEFQAPLIGAGETVQFIAQESVPVDWLNGVHESVAQLAFLYWVRFSDADGRRWEVVYDPEARRCDARPV